MAKVAEAPLPTHINVEPVRRMVGHTATCEVCGDTIVVGPWPENMAREEFETIWLPSHNH